MVREDMIEEQFLKHRFGYKNEDGRIAIDATEQEEIAPKLNLSTSYLLWSYPTCYGFLASVHILRVGQYSVPDTFYSAFPVFALLGTVYLYMLTHRVYWLMRFSKYKASFERQSNAYLRLFCSSDIRKAPDFIREDWRQTEKWFRQTSPSEDNLQLTGNPLMICAFLVYVSL